MGPMVVRLLSGCRTPMGGLLGSLSRVPAPELGAAAIRGALARARVDAGDVDEVLMGNALQAGVGQAPARQAALLAGLPDSVPCATVGKVCGSGMLAIIQGAQAIRAGDRGTVVAGGMENMSLAPHLVPRARRGVKFGGGELVDSMERDGLRDARDGRAMGLVAEDCASRHSFSREEQDAFAAESFRRARRAQEDGAFDGEIEPVATGGGRTADLDEGPPKADFGKMGGLAPAFSKDGTITAANASSINDGAAAVVLAGGREGDAPGFRLVAHAGHAQDPGWFTTAPAAAMRKCLDRAGLAVGDVGLFEINEAFAVVAMAAMRDLGLPADRVNVHGGAVALGHPIGCSGARIVVTLMSAMERRGERLGMASICIGGGEALSVIIERTETGGAA